MRNYLLLFLVMITTDVFPGVLSISFNGQDVTEKSVVIEGKISDESMKASLVITNTSGSVIQVKVRKTEIKTISGTQNSFCLGECYPPMVMESPNPLHLAANSSTAKDVFYAEYYPNGHAGISEIRFEVYEAGNTNNKASVIVSFAARDVTGADNIQEQEKSLTIFPNPVKHGYCTIHISPALIQLPLKMEITGMTGVKHVAIPEIHEKYIGISTDRLSNGIYIIILYSKGKLIFREKLIIQRD